MKKVVKDLGEDEDFMSGSWVNAIDYVNVDGDISCSPNVIGDLTVTMKDLSGTIPGKIHHKVINEGGYRKNITVRAALILANVSVFSSKPSMHYLSIPMRNVFKANPRESHLIVVKRIFRYLKEAPNLGLWYPKGLGFEQKAYSESDYAGCNLDRKSTSAEAEYVVIAGCCAQVLLIKSQLAYYDVLYDKVPIFCNNTSSIAISNNPVLHSRTKHINIGYHFIRDHILKGDIELHFVPTDLQLNDIFTKLLAEPGFTRLVAELEPINSLIPPSKEVNADDSTDKSSFGTNVQPVTQPKAPTDLKSRKKRNPPSSKPKTLNVTPRLTLNLKAVPIFQQWTIVLYDIEYMQTTSAS
ncbi:retrovirus-related pol polyprotein from transposon TNT 1-94 [Tanacetum coccineum]